MTQALPSHTIVVSSAKNLYLDNLDVEERVLHGVSSLQHLVVESSDELVGFIERADAIISWHPVPLPRTVLENLVRCRGIVRAAVGFDNIDIQSAREFGIPVCNVPDYGTEEVADHTLALALALRRRLLAMRCHVESGRWDWRCAGAPPRTRGSVFGIVGLGRIGTAVALRARVFGFRVVFFDPFRSPGTEKALGCERVRTLEELLRIADVLSLHVPLSSNTHHLIGRNELALLKQEAILVNTSRGAVVETGSLVERISTVRTFACGLDVLEDEPFVPRSLLSCERVILTPHSAFYSAESLLELREKAAQIVVDCLVGRELTTCVNAPELVKEGFK